MLSVAIMKTKKSFHFDFQDVDNCIGCMVSPADVKLLKRCDTTDDSPPAAERQQQQANENEPCMTCYCRPMWCITCMGKWYDNYY